VGCSDASLVNTAFTFVGAFCLHLEDGNRKSVGYSLTALKTWRWGQQATTKHLYLYINPPGVTYQKTIVVRFTVIPYHVTRVVSRLISLRKQITVLPALFPPKNVT